MNPRDFCYWLRGYMELTDASIGEKIFNQDQWNMIKEHLNKVFNQTDYRNIDNKTKRLCGYNPQDSISGGHDSDYLVFCKGIDIG